MQIQWDGLVIRPPLGDDFVAWSTLWSAYLEFYETSRPATVHRTLFSRLLSDDQHTFRGLVADMDGVLVGLAHYLFHPHGWRIEDTCYLQDLYVADDARGSGLGRKLIEAVYAAADANGTPSVYWLTQDFNATARRLYDRVGEVTRFIRYNRAS